MSWLLIGGGGYIGSHVAATMVNSGYSVVIADQNEALYQGEYLSELEYLVIDATETSKIKEIFTRRNIEGVINFAALKSVSDSFENPSEYKRVNHKMSIDVIDLAINENTEYFIQASTAAVYGPLANGIANEESVTAPISPYGSTKLESEKYLTTMIQSGKIKGVSFRFFNVGGSITPSMKDKAAGNILPMVLRAVKAGQRPVIFGDDYPTPDGTAVRDYVHVLDIADAHILTIQKLKNLDLSPVMNLGAGHGVSVLEVVNEILKQLNVNLTPEIAPRRVGDIASLVADIGLASEEIGYTPSRSLRDIVQSTVWE